MLVLDQPMETSHEGGPSVSTTRTARRGHIKKRTLKSRNAWGGKEYRWDIVWYVGRNESGRKIYKWKRGFLTAADAERALTEKLDNPVRPGTLAAFLDSWLTSRQTHIRPSTLASYRWTLTKYLIPVLGDVPLSDLKPEHLTKLYASLTISPKSIRNLHGVVRRSLKDAVAWGYATRNVAALVQPPALRRPEIVAWSPEQLRTFLDAVKDDRFYAAWRLFATTGMRRGEVAGLRWEDVAEDRLHVRAPRVVVSGKVTTSEPKTRAGRRTVSLDPETVNALAAIPRRGDLISPFNLVSTYPGGQPEGPIFYMSYPL
jgi:integrase